MNIAKHLCILLETFYVALSMRMLAFLNVFRKIVVN